MDAGFATLALALALLGCGSTPPAARESTVTDLPPAEVAPASTSLRVRSVGVPGEYPLPDDVGASLTLHLVDGDVATAWRPAGIARLEVDAAELRWVEILQTGIQRVRWRPLHAGPDGTLTAGEWHEVDLTQVAPVGGGPWLRFTAAPEPPVRGVELEAMDTPANAVISEIRLVGAPQGPDPGVRSTRWTAVTSSTPEGPFQLDPGRIEALDPHRCTVWVGGEEQRGEKGSCKVDGERVTIGIGPPDAPESLVHELEVREVGPCFALIEGHPYSRCDAPAAAEAR